MSISIDKIVKVDLNPTGVQNLPVSGYPTTVYLVPENALGAATEGYVYTSWAEFSKGYGSLINSSGVLSGVELFFNNGGHGIALYKYLFIFLHVGFQLFQYHLLKKIVFAPL